MSILLVALTIASAESARAQTSPVDPIEPDRPDVTNGTHIVDIGLLQLEFGAILTKVSGVERTFGSPFTARVGLLDWLEARIGTDGLVMDTISGTRQSGVGNLQIGAKLRLWASGGGVPVLSLLPTVNLPTASAAKGLGSGEADYLLAALTGTDLGRHGHVDVNYGIGSIGAPDGQSHFVQQLYSVSASAAASNSWNPYTEAFWISRQDPGGAGVAAVDAGAIVELGARYAIDGGVQVGLGGTAPDVAVFAGLSMIVGDILGSHGVHARERHMRSRLPTSGPRK